MNPSASKVSILGQSMEIVIHITNEPKNTPNTAIASEERPPNSGTSLDPIIIANDKIKKNISLLFTALSAILLLSPFIGLVKSLSALYAKHCRHVFHLSISYE